MALVCMWLQQLLFPSPSSLKRKCNFMITKRSHFFLLTTQSLHTFIAQIISGLTIILIQTHEGKATALGFGAFCARHFSKYDKTSRNSATSIHKNQFSEKACMSSHKTLIIICETQENKKLNDKRRNTVEEKLVIKMLG